MICIIFRKHLVAAFLGTRWPIEASVPILEIFSELETQRKVPHLRPFAKLAQATFEAARRRGRWRGFLFLFFGFLMLCPATWALLFSWIQHTKSLKQQGLRPELWIFWTLSDLYVNNICCRLQYIWTISEVYLNDIQKYI